MSGREAMWFGVGIIYGSLLGIYGYKRMREWTDRVGHLQGRVWELEAKERERELSAHAPQPEAA